MVQKMRYLASVVTNTFVAFGDILSLHKRFVELSGGVQRIQELRAALADARTASAALSRSYRDHGTTTTTTGTR